MHSQDSIHRWLRAVEQGDEDAARELWACCFPELVRFARKKLAGTPQRVADEEDVAISAMRSFYRAVQRGRFRTLAGRDELFRLLFRITSRKAVDLMRRETSKRRGRGRVRGDSAFGAAADTARTGGLPVDQSCTPELAVLVTEELRRLLGMLPDVDLQRLALGKMEGYTNEEMARDLKCSLRTVERRLFLIRRIWEQEALA
jgi:DNA-directed RNA polymerase specialized sigma24 family protein